MSKFHVRRRLAGAAAAVAASTVLLTGAIAVPAQADIPEGTVLAVTGTNRALYARVAGQPGWTNFGGALAAAPAVVAVDGVVHFIGTGTDKALYHRTATTGWHRLANAYCTDVSAALGDGVVLVSCRGGNGALYAAQFDATQQRPTAAFTKIGGVIQGAAPILWTDMGPQYFVRGGAYRTGEGGEFVANTYTWDVESGWRRYDAWCDGTPAVDSSATVLFFACQHEGAVIAGESLHPVEGGTYEWSFFDVPGQAIGTPALAMTGEDQAELFVQGADKVVYHRTLGVDGPTGPRWSKISSAVLGGVAAAPFYRSAP